MHKLRSLAEMARLAERRENFRGLGRGRGLDEAELTGLVRARAVPSPGGSGRPVRKYSPEFLRAVHAQLSRSGPLELPYGVLAEDAPLRQKEPSQNKASAPSSRDSREHTASATRTVPARTRPQRSADSPSRASVSPQEPSSASWRRSSSRSHEHENRSAPSSRAPAWMSPPDSSATDFASAAKQLPVLGGFPPAADEPDRTNSSDHEADDTQGGAPEDAHSHLSTAVVQPDTSKTADDAASPALELVHTGQQRQSAYDEKPSEQQQQQQQERHLEGEEEEQHERQQEQTKQQQQKNNSTEPSQASHIAQKNAGRAELLGQLGIMPPPEATSDAQVSGHASYALDDGFESGLWEYVDPVGCVHGPFPSAQIIDWFNDGYFPRDLRIRRHNPSTPAGAKDGESFQQLYLLLPTLRSQAHDELRLQQQRQHQRTACRGNVAPAPAAENPTNAARVERYHAYTLEPSQPGINRDSCTSQHAAPNSAARTDRRESGPSHFQSQGINQLFDPLSGPQLFNTVGKAQQQSQHGLFQSSGVSRAEQSQASVSQFTGALQQQQHPQQHQQRLPPFDALASPNTGGVIPNEQPAMASSEAYASAHAKPPQPAMHPQQAPHPNAPAEQMDPRYGNTFPGHSIQSQRNDSQQDRRERVPQQDMQPAFSQAQPATTTKYGGFGSQAAPVQHQSSSSSQQPSHPNPPAPKLNPYQRPDPAALQRLMNDPFMHQLPGQNERRSDDEMTPYDRVMMHLRGSRSQAEQADAKHPIQWQAQNAIPHQAQQQHHPPQSATPSYAQTDNATQQPMMPGSLQQAFAAQSSQQQPTPLPQTGEAGQPSPQSVPSSWHPRLMTTQQPSPVQQQQLQHRSTSAAYAKSLRDIQQEEEEAQRAQQNRSTEKGMHTPAKSPGSWAAAAGRMQGQTNVAQQQQQYQEHQTFGQAHPQQRAQGTQHSSYETPPVPGHQQYQQQYQQTGAAHKTQEAQEQEHRRSDARGVADGQHPDESPFESFCRERLLRLNVSDDAVDGVMRDLLQLGSATEVQEYVGLNIGASPEAKGFVNDFLKWLRSEASGSSSRRRRKKK